MQTPNYIRQLLLPTNGKKASRRVWSIDLETVWLPFFTATNTMGDTRIPSECLGSPIRLAHAKDGSIKFSDSGRPITRVVKELGDSVRLVRDNFTASLVGYANQVADKNPEGYGNQVAMAREAGMPIVNKDRQDLHEAIEAQVAEAMMEVQAKTPEPVPEPVNA